jgi:hypothetical protein
MVADSLLGIIMKPYTVRPLPARGRRMATKVFCDACGKESGPESGTTVFEYLCHIPPLARCERVPGYVLLDGPDVIPVSGRREKEDLCPRCYNEVLVAAVRKLHELQGETP